MHPKNAIIYKEGIIMYCQNCGSQLSDNSNFCPNCGSKKDKGSIPTEQNQYDTQQHEQPQYQPPQYQQYEQPYKKPRKKRKGCLITLLIGLGIIVLLLVIAALNGGEIGFSTANVAEAYMASQINEATAEPVVKTDTFSTNDSVVYATAKIKNVPSDTKVTAIWHYIPTGESLPSENYITVNKDMWVQFSLENPNGFVPGDYKVEIVLNDEVVKTLNFTVK